jgi:ABC-type multidrug transport system ATPase subunit
MPTPVIDIAHVSRRFGALLAVDDVSLEVQPGEVVGLLGPNGAGKTTTLRMLSGLLSTSGGHCRLGGFDVHTHPLEARRQLGFLTASTNLYERLTGREVLRIFGELQGLSREALDARVAAVIDELELQAFVDQRCGTLSSGQKQRISIGRAVVHDPVACVLDEPTAALDPVASRDILSLVTRARDRGKAVLFSTHRMEEAEFLCSRLYFMRQGRVVAQGSPAELVERSGQRSLTAAFLHFAEATP